MQEPVSLHSIIRFSFKKYALWFGGWTFAALMLASNEFADAYRAGFKGDTWEPWVWIFSGVYALSLVAPVIIYFCHRWPLDHENRLNTILKFILLYFPVMITFVTIMHSIRHVVYLIVRGTFYPIDDYVGRYIYELNKGVTLFFAILFLTYTYISLKRIQENKIEAARLQGELNLARLENLQRQLQPHFLFNTLNAISNTMYEDVDKADSIIGRLSELLRFSLATSQQPFVTLKQELEITRAFLEIALLRYGDKLQTKYNIDQNSVDIMVPSMILQPLVENALKYAVELSDGTGTIEIITKVLGEELQIDIIDSGAEENPDDTVASFGIGLSNTRKRLEYLYANKHSLKIIKQENGGTNVSLTLPTDKLIKENDG